MRKLFWSCCAAGVFVAAGVFTMAHLAVRRPDSFVGQVMYGASRVAFVMNPFSGLNPALVRLEKAQKAFDGHGAEEPAEVAEPADELRGFEPAPVAEPAAAVPILIPEDEPVPAAPMPVLPDELCPAQHADPFLAGTECPAGDDAPPAMPRCEEECDDFERIGIDFNDPELAWKGSFFDCEKLHMPKVEGEGEEQDANAECPLGCADKLLRMFEKMIKRAVCPAEEPEAAPECREDAHRHHHHQGCPYTGRSYPGCPGMQPCQPPALPPEPAKEKPANDDGSQSVLHKVRRFKTRIDEFCPVHADVDTMEHRATDRTLHDLSAGPL